MRRSSIGMLACALVAALASNGPAGAARTVADARVEPGLLDATVPTRVLARFDGAAPDLSEVPGLSELYRFQAVPAVAVTASPAALRTLAAREDLAYLEADKPVELDLDSAVTASRVKEVLDGVAGFDAIDGSGVGIAVVDSGLDMLHPDYQAPGKVAANYQVTPAGVLEQTLPWTAYMHGHGTHVAGIAAGNGLASDGAYRGAAPGATLYAFDMYVGTQALAAIAFDWILAHGHEQDPPIRVVNNSWHCSASSCAEAFNPDQLHIAVATELAEAGYVIAWAAGNHDTDEGNDGLMSSTNVEAHNQVPGIIGVANYNDHLEGQAGVRTGCLSKGSSRGASVEPVTWPDLAAPGSNVTSTWAITPLVDAEDKELESRNPMDGSMTYRALSGTSMASPHVAGIVALMLQLRPDLSPADVEYILKASATKLTHCAYDYDGSPTTPPTPNTYVRADAAHPWDGSNYADGHGLVDAVAALEMTESFAGIPSSVPTEAIPDAFVRVRPGVDALHTLYLKGDAALEPGFPDAAAPRVLPMAPGQTLTFTSAPLTEAVTAEALKADLYLGTTGEAVAKLNPPRIRVEIDRVPDDAPAAEIAQVDRGLWQIGPLGPTQRDIVIPLADPIAFEPGDAVRLRVSVISPEAAAGVPAPYAFWTLYWESITSSRVTLGTIVPRPATGTRAWCEARQDCAQLDETHVYEGMTCSKTSVLLTWEGPPGSSLVYTCAGHVATCAIPPSEPAGGGRCQTEWEAPHALVFKGGTCSYHIPGGARGGSGRCVLTQLTEEDD